MINMPARSAFDPEASVDGRDSARQSGALPGASASSQPPRTCFHLTPNHAHSSCGQPAVHDSGVARGMAGILRQNAASTRASRDT
jgi:hypothetical protein